MKIRMLSLLALVSISSLIQVANAEICSGQEYLRRRPDVQAAGMSPRDHYMMYGWSEGMCIPDVYQCSVENYLNQRPDVRAAGVNVYAHYWFYGRFEGMCEPTK